jgi:hypothetical protein
MINTSKTAAAIEADWGRASARTSLWICYWSCDVSLLDNAATGRDGRPWPRHTFLWD